MVVGCSLLVTITIATTLVIMVVFCTSNDNYDQWLVNQQPTNHGQRQEQLRGADLSLSLSLLSLLLSLLSLSLLSLSLLLLSLSLLSLSLLSWY